MKTLPPTLLVALAAFALYGLTRPAVGYNSDVYSYILAIREGDPRLLWNPHHLLHGPAGYAFTRSLGWTGMSFDGLLRLMSAAFGALAVTAFWHLVARFVASPARRALATFGFASTFAIWMFSVDVEVYIPSTAFLIVSYLLLTRAAARGSLAVAALAGLAMGMGTLFHQMGALFVVVGLPVFWTANERPSRKLLLLAAFAGAGAALVLPVYLWAGAAWHGVRSFRDFVVWTLGYSLRGYGAGWSLRNLAEAALGHGRSLVFFEFVLRDLQRRAPFVLLELGLVALVGLLLAGGSLGALRGWWHAGAARRAAPLSGLVTWYASYAVFTFWWEPDNPEFWVTAMVPFWALWAGGLLVLPGRRGTAVVATLCGVMFACNLLDLVRRRSLDHDPEVRAAHVLAERLGEGDTVLLSPTLDARAAVFVPDVKRIGVYLVCKENRDTESAAAALEKAIAAARTQGRVFFYERAFSKEVLSPHPWCRDVLARFRERHSFTPAFDVELPVDDDGGDGRRVAHWQPVPVLEVQERAE